MELLVEAKYSQSRHPYTITAWLTQHHSKLNTLVLMSLKVSH